MEKIYRVKVLPGGKRLSYRTKGGGVYVNKSAAMERVDYLRTYYDKNVVLLESEVDWKETGY